MKESTRDKILDAAVLVALALACFIAFCYGRSLKHDEEEQAAKMAEIRSHATTFLKCVEIADHYCVTYAEVKQDAQTK